MMASPPLGGAASRWGLLRTPLQHDADEERHEEVSQQQEQAAN